MAVATETALERRVCGQPADDPRVFAYLVEAAAAMFAVVFPAPTAGRRSGGESESMQEEEVG